MKKRIVLEFAGILIFVIGLLFLINSRINMTGAVLGSHLTLLPSFFIGMVLIIMAIIVFSSAALALENRVALSSSIKQHPPLMRLEKDAVNDQDVEREMNHLIDELSRGNFESGLGHPGHVEGTNIFYLRGRNGARLYYHRTGKDSYEVVGKSAKGRNQDQVINKLKEFYH
jgi:hypothetical protein